ncbi:Uncharacterised protein [Mycobacteroides abscessus subsp. abscessus]|nr:Uncharacterised protein [Mycobacteroides abscessus subsp. abscessus]SKX40618.1 Uncharacterised protein [Mycobacteroides abscessus subsp. abscessus]
MVTTLPPVDDRAGASVTLSRLLMAHTVTAGRSDRRVGREPPLRWLR